jgi:hypothetical protein
MIPFIPSNPRKLPVKAVLWLIAELVLVLMVRRMGMEVCHFDTDRRTMQKLFLGFVLIVAKRDVVRV